MGMKKRGTGSLPVLEANAAGINIGSAEHWVAVPIDRDNEPVRSFSALTRGLHELADWLEACGIRTEQANAGIRRVVAEARTTRPPKPLKDPLV